MQNSNYNVSKIARILNSKVNLINPLTEIKFLLIDSRNITSSENSLFFALKSHRDGHSFIADAYQKNIRNFVISDADYIGKYADCNFVLVDDVLKSLQVLAQYHKEQFNLKTIGITGSNGKTVVKEWLYQLLHSDFNIVRSPKSFNSQIGVPLSVWQINNDNNLAIFEAGVSAKNEMESLENIIKPEIGILTNIGEAHAQGFASKEEKLKEKLLLFKNSTLLIYSPDYVEDEFITDFKAEKFTWSSTQKADLQVVKINIDKNSYLNALYKGEQIECVLPFKDRASIENAIICWATLLALGFEANIAAEKLALLNAVSMRLELKNGINQCSIIDDSYSADISSLSIALDFLNQQNQQDKKTIILSDLVETGKADDKLYAEIAQLIKEKKVNRLIGIGPKIAQHAGKFNLEKEFFTTTDLFLEAYANLKFNHEIILVKGARRFGFERISKLLALKIHDTVLEVDLNAMVNNLQFYRSKLKPKVKIMAMVKAFSYGSGSFEIANLLQFHKIDYLTVAYADEGFALRKAGITLPIMVMSPEESAFDAVIKYNLEPEIYSIDVLTKYINSLPSDKKQYPIHLKIDSGMHRLGFNYEEISQLLSLISTQDNLLVKSIFSHLVGSDSPEHDNFTEQQIAYFKNTANQIIDVLGYKPLLHISNTSAIIRWPEANLDMVRLGIGLYGFDSAIKTTKSLQTVMTLKTTISQVKKLPAGETVGYSRRGVLPNGGTIATVKIGYADGYSRAFGNGVGKMLVNGVLVPTIGSICMDMTMLNVTGVNVKVGDEVVVFNAEHTIEDLANAIGTIPYEILTSVSQRVKRVYLYD
jgi:alanine racemase